MSRNSNNAFDDWVSLYSTKLESVWKIEETELRNVFMLTQVLKWEFKRIEDKMNDKITDMKRKLSDGRHTPPVDLQPPVSLKTSPKLQRYSKTFQFKKLKNNTSTEIDAHPEKDDFSLLTSKRLSDKCNTFINTSCNNENDKTHIKDCVWNKENFEMIDLVNSSIVITETSNRSYLKKPKQTRKEVSKSNTHTFPNLHKAKKPKMSDDELKDKRSNKSKEFIENVQKQSDRNVVNHDKRIEMIAERQQPQYVYKTETVRRKIDRLKLPGWSCNQCKEYYEGLNLSPKELCKKMDICSKHRNVFQPSNDTIAGFWDVTISESQETDDSDITRIN